MSYSTMLRSAVCGAALITASTAQADISAQDVWDSWKSQINDYSEGSLSIGAEETSGDTLAVRNIRLNFAANGATVLAQMGDITFETQRDGNIKVIMPPQYPITVTAPNDNIITLTASQSDLEIIASGDPDNISYTVTADNYTFTLDNIVDGNVTITGDWHITANDITADYTVETNDVRNINYTSNIASLDFLADIKIPSQDADYITASGKILNMQSQGNGQGNIPSGVNLGGATSFAEDEFEFTGSYSLEKADYVFDIEVEDSRAAGSFSLGETVLDSAFSDQTVRYNVKSQDIAVSVAPNKLAFPVDVNLAEYGVGLEMPHGKADAPENFGLQLDIVDLTLNDPVWDMFDANAVLPRDPATVQLDITGTAKPLFDIFDKEQQDNFAGPGLPIELNTLSLNNLRIALAGALVSGQGAFTFDNTDLATFNGLPRPEGNATVAVTGLNGMIDNLVAMGLVPEEQVLGGRMMLGMFTRATGDDQLETQLEVNPEGHIIVNGQRIK